MKIFFPIKGISEYTSGYRAYKSSIIQKAMLIYGNDFIQLKEFGFACTLEKIVKLKLIGAKFSEIPFVLNYDMKTSKSKMVFTSTTMGYIILLVMYYWPFSGWKYFKFKHSKTI
jgi:dolichol-phosphate mannosyltransferase